MSREWNKIQDISYINNLPKEDCEIWITRERSDGHRWVQKIDYYINEGKISWHGVIAWMLYINGDTKPEAYSGNDVTACHLF